ncbi:hypothetical protein OIU79_018806 [Salix purpurea]|uniref:Uncharacterized protein n=1 Tax=Salix purpurea TaxID=77065 RepID=A0A9Q0NZP4_SALPP|nr:hypothetical protein OIU79_018806 [Salix purpurea]
MLVMEKNFCTDAAGNRIYKSCQFKFLCAFWRVWLFIPQVLFWNHYLQHFSSNKKV